MGFFRSFLGSAISQAIRDDKKEKQKLAEWNTLFRECMDMDLEFNDFLRRLGIDDGHVCRAELPDEGRAAVNAEKRKLDNYRKKINDFISLGGKASNIWSYEEIDDYLVRIKYLRANGYLDQQDEWIQTDIELLKVLLPMDIEAKSIMRNAIEKQAAQEKREALVKSVGFDVDTLSGTDFEAVCQTLVEKMGFTTKTTKTTGDGGIDIIAYNSQPLLSGKYIIQCKRYSGSVGEPILRDLYGVVTSERANKGILMTTGYFTRPAISFAEDKPLELIDGAKLRELMETYLKDDYRIERMVSTSSQPVTTASVAVNTNSSNSAPPKKKLNIPPEYEWLRAELEQEPVWYGDDNCKVELSNFMTVSTYKLFNNWMEKSKCDPSNQNARCRALEILHDSIAVRLRMGSRTIEEIHATANLLRTLVYSVQKHDFKYSDDEQTQYLYYMCLLIDGEIDFWTGHLETAISKWVEVLEDFASLNKSSNPAILARKSLLFSIWTCMNYLEMNDELTAFYNKHQKVIDELAKIYKREAENVDPNSYNADKEKATFYKKYNCFLNPQNARYTIAVKLNGWDDASEDSTLLCNGNNKVFTVAPGFPTVRTNAIEFDDSKNLYYMGSDEDVNSPFYSKFLLIKGR